MCVDLVDEYVMYLEYIEVFDDVVKVVVEMKVKGGCVIVVGIILVCLLEFVVKVYGGKFDIYFGDIDIFIYLGY